ncbi:hypothetical protein [Saccharothrix luteola]|uniref:hypothetical protein n=1 Tax=Saccharothrix luteola TaxID=2893018 RepID=UPI001E284941|nr:hypothetical protein [Saccharothrix luteola]MCC8250119.1 hypothetical protein [Saccharothrix luteola]
MSEQPLQVSRAVLGFRRGPRLRHGLAAASLIAAVVSLAPRWWAQAAVAGGQWVGRHWAVWVFALVAAAISAAMPLLVHGTLLLAAAAAGVGVVLWACWDDRPVSRSGSTP